MKALALAFVFALSSCNWFPYVELTVGRAEQFGSTLEKDHLLSKDGDVLLVTMGLRYVKPHDEYAPIRVIVVSEAEPKLGPGPGPKPVVEDEVIPVTDPRHPDHQLHHLIGEAKGLAWWQFYGIIALIVITLLTLAYLVKIGKIAVPGFKGRNGGR